MSRISKNYLHRNGVSLIELLFFQFNVLVGLSLAIYVYKYFGIWLAIPVGVIGFFISITLILALGKFLDLIFPPYPIKCEDGKCDLWECYHVRIGSFQTGNKTFPRQGIVYYRCHCGHEYIDFGRDIRAKVNDDGTLKTYMKKTKWRGWQKDERGGFEDTFLIIEPEMLSRLREGIQKDID